MSERPHIEHAVREDPRYRDGLGHMQAARWAKAIECFLLLTRDYPESALAQRALEEAQFKADLDSRTTVRAVSAHAGLARKWVTRILVAVLVVVLVWQGLPMVTNQVIPAIRNMQLTEQVNELLAAGNQALEADKLDAAEVQYNSILALVAQPAADGSATMQAVDSRYDRQVAVALDGLEQIALHRDVAALYAEGLSLQEQNRVREALDALHQVARLWPGYRDADTRIAEMSRTVGLEDLFTQAETLRQAGQYTASLEVYEEIRSTNLSYRREMVTSRLFELYLEAGKQLLRTASPDRDIRELYTEAQAYFKEALSLQPRSEEVAFEQALVAQYEAAETVYYEANWPEAVAELGAVYDAAPDYLGGRLADMYYDALIRRANDLRETGDNYGAFDLFLRAAGLLVSDTSAAQAGIAAFDALALPTPTPGPTSVPTARPQATARLPVGAGATGTATAPTSVPLSTYRGKILFLSDKPGEQGIWVMDADGSDREYLGNSQELYQQHSILVSSYRYSPGGERAFVKNDSSGIAQIWVAGVGGETQLTRLDGICYDPAWSPSGREIVFVSQGKVPDSDTKRDNIWVVDAAGGDPQVLTPTENWWEKHPSWSPDGSRIAFWSSQDGPQQIFTMTPAGGMVTNISNTNWNEYDPVWVR